MKVSETKLAGVLIFEPKVFSDSRGYFFESWSQERYEEAGIQGRFVQDNISFSKKGVLRGLHFQYPKEQGKLVQVLWGEVFDVAVDIRVGSATFGEWIASELTGENHKQMYIPAGFAHGFCVQSEGAIFSYKCTEYYDSNSDSGIRWDDSEIGIEWPVSEPVLSDKDKDLPLLKDISKEKLPQL